MLNTGKKIIALMLAVILVFSLAGCSGTGDEMSSGGVIYVDNEVYVDADGNPVTDGDTAGDGDTQGSNQPGNNPQTNNSGDGGNTSTTNGVDPTKYENTTVVFATTILSEQDESGPVVDAFEKKYKITVKEILVGDNVNEIAGLLASGTNVDVMRTCQDFPAAMAVLQPLTAAKLDMTDPIWDKSVFDYTTFGGEPYCCNTVGNIWTENACVIYSKQLLKQASCSTPEDYDKAGKWTWDAYAAIAKAVDNIDGLGTGIRGTYVDDLYLLGSMGCTLYGLEDGKFVNGLKNPLHAEAMAKIASWSKEGFVTNSVENPFAKGNTGIVCGLGWSLKKNGSNANYNWNDIGFYHMPAYKEGMTAGGTAMFKAWGICRGSDNPVGAGLFLRYYLDCGNYNTKDAFISDEAADFFFSMTNNLSMENFTPMFNSYTSTQPLTGFQEWDYMGLYLGDPNQMGVKFSQITDSVDNAVDVMNKFVAKNTGIRE